jgi:hypothetical protein
LERIALTPFASAEQAALSYRNNARRPRFRSVIALERPSPA